MSILDMGTLTTVDATPSSTTSTGTGPWVKNPGKPGTVHAEISDTTNPTATVVVEYSNTLLPKGPVIEDTLTFTTAGQGRGSTLFNGYQYVRIRCTAISGSGAYVLATLGLGA